MWGLRAVIVIYEAIFNVFLARISTFRRSSNSGVQQTHVVDTS